MQSTRVVAVTLGLVVAGSVVGGALGVGLLAALGLLVDGRGGYPYVWDAFVVAGVLGTLLGGVLAPLTSWLFLRHVPFSRVFGGTAAGTALGAASGLLASALNEVVAVGASIAGFSLGVVVLRLTSRPVQAEIRVPAD